MLKIKYGTGFFSCCSVRLQEIITFFNFYKKLPYRVDSSLQFALYKPIHDKKSDITHEYFDENLTNKYVINYKTNINYHNIYQFKNYKNIDIHSLIPFLIKYFSPSIKIKSIVRFMELKYKLTKQYNNICVLFHRGNDKSTETKICSHEEIIRKAKEYFERNPNTVFLLQSDETEFIEKAFKEFPTNSIVFKDEIRHIRKNNNKTVDIIMKDYNHLFSKYYLAITIIMSKCNYIICGSGNCSIWIIFYRGHSNNVLQYLNGEWL